MIYSEVVNLLEHLCFYKEVEITHTFKDPEGKQVLMVRCLTNRDIIEVTNLEDGYVAQYEDNSDAAAAILSSLDKHYEKAAP